MAMAMGGAITAVAATTMVGTAATTMAGGIITIGGDFHLRPKKGTAVGGCLFSFNVSPRNRTWRQAAPTSASERRLLQMWWRESWV